MTTNDDTARSGTDCLLLGIANLEACKLDDMVLAWSYGLGVKFQDGYTSATAVSLTIATPIVEPLMFRIFNGNNESARLVRRQDAIAAQLVELRKLVSVLEGT